MTKVKDKIKETPTEELTLEERNKENSKRDFTKVIKQIQSEFAVSYFYMKPKWNEWAIRLKLYNNQKRDRSAIGDPLLFTIHQTVLASLYMDRLSATFEHREAGDEETAENLNDLAEFDYDEMQKDEIDYIWDWDASFFGRGLLMLMEFDTKMKCPVCENWDPMTTLRDPKARSVNGDMRGRGRARWIGREIRLTKYEMEKAGYYFNFEDLKPDNTDIKSLVDEYAQLRADAQGYSNMTVPETLEGDNQTYRLLEWITRYEGKLYIITLADDRKQVVRFSPIQGDNIPIIDRSLYPTRDWDGVSVCDLVEDKQRAKAKLINLGIKVAEAGLYPMYLFDNNRIKNRADLNYEQNKFISVSGDPTGAVQIMPRDQVKQDVGFILNTLDTAAQKATATPDLQQGQLSEEERTATELTIASQKVDIRYSLSARVFGWSEKMFWRQWYFLYKTYFEKGIEEKVIRIKGVLGAKFRPLRRENIIAKIDPDVRISSRVVSEAENYNNLQIFRAYVQMIAQDPTVNLRYAEMKLGKLSGLKKDELDQLFPKTVEEILAEEENEALEANQLAVVRATDDHQVHLYIHNRLSDTPAKFAHIRAHKKAMLHLKENPDLLPEGMQDQMQMMNPTGGEGVGENPLELLTGGRGSSAIAEQSMS